MRPEARTQLRVGGQQVGAHSLTIVVDLFFAPMQSYVRLFAAILFAI